MTRIGMRIRTITEDENADESEDVNDSENRNKIRDENNMMLTFTSISKQKLSLKLFTLFLFIHFCPGYKRSIHQ